MGTHTATLLVCVFFVSILAYDASAQYLPMYYPHNPPRGNLQNLDNYWKAYDSKTGKMMVGYVDPNKRSANEEPQNGKVVVKPTINITKEIIVDNQGPLFPSGSVVLPALPPGMGYVPVPEQWNYPNMPPPWYNQNRPPQPPGNNQNPPPQSPGNNQNPPQQPPGNNQNPASQPPGNNQNPSPQPPGNNQNPSPQPPGNNQNPPPQPPWNNQNTPPPAPTHIQHVTPPAGVPPQNPPRYPGNMKIVVNPDSKIIALLNETAQVGIAFDFADNIVLLMNGNNGDMVFIDYNTRKGIRTDGQKSRLFWKASLVKFEVYISKVPCLKNLLPIANEKGKKFSIDSADPSILKLVAEIADALGAKIGNKIKKDFSNAIELMVKLVKRLKNLKSDILRQFRQRVTDVADITIENFVDIFERLPIVIQKLVGGVKTLVVYKIHLNLHLIFRVKSGIEIVKHVIDASTAAGVKTLVAVKDMTISKLFETIALISGPASVGYGALVRVIGLLIGVVKGTVKIEPFIDALVKLSVTTLPANAFQLLASQLQNLLNSLGNLPQDAGVKQTIEDVKKLISGNLVIGKVNISKIISSLVEAGIKPPLQLVVNVLVAIKSVVDIAKSIPTFVLYVLTKLVKGVGYQAVYKLFPDLKISDDVIASGNLSKVILKDINFVNFVWSGFDVIKFLRKLPIIGDILKAVEVALKTSSNGALSLFDLLKSAVSYVVLRKIGWLLGLPPNAFL